MTTAPEKLPELLRDLNDALAWLRNGGKSAAAGQFIATHGDTIRQLAALRAEAAPLAEGREVTVPANVTVSVDVSTGEADAQRRIFALTTGDVMDHLGEPVIICVEESRNFADRCFACGRKVGAGQQDHEVDTRDGQTVYVGSECFKKIKAAGDEGWQPPKGGPRLWLLATPTAQRVAAGDFTERHGVDLRGIKVGEVLTTEQWEAVCAFVRDQERIIDEHEALAAPVAVGGGK